jgi:hypothetical protein
MKKNNICKLLICFILSTVLLSINHAAYASWVYLSVDDLIEKSDSVLIGKVVNQTGYTKENIPSIMWQVKVDYYLKGEIRDQLVTVITPSSKLSVHYNLDEWGKRVLLFICKSGDYYSPLSPQAVIPVNLNGNISKSSSSISGKDLVRNIKITDPKSDGKYRAELEAYIESRDIFLPDKIVQPQKAHNSLIYWFAVIIGISTVLVILLFKFGKKRKTV